MEVPTTLRYLADALEALYKADESCSNDYVCEHIRSAEDAIYRALRQTASSQSAPDDVCLDETGETVT